MTGNAKKDESTNLRLTPNELRDILKEACAYAYDNDMEINFTSPC
jgi:hypothetical protein